MDAIVYTSNTGHTKGYAELLGKETGLPVYELSEAARVLPEQAPVIYFGWLMAGRIKGYKKAARRFDIKAVCGVGMAAIASQLADIRKTNPIPEETPAFCLQGGFELDKLHGIYKLMMRTMKKTVGRSLANKKNRTAEEDDMLNMMINGGNRVSIDHLNEIKSWYFQQND